ncbi:MAG: signal peptidase I [Planctomycetota bacterium]|jgi:signal peptidase I
MEESGRASGPEPDDRDILTADAPGEPEDPGDGRKSSRLWWGLGLAKSALEVAVIAAALWLFVFQVSVVSGHSMDPSLEPGDRLVVDKLSYRWRRIRRFDVVVFECPTQRGVDYVKRVVGLPGETVELRGGELYVDGELVGQEFDHVDDLGSYPPVGVPEGEYYVLGDNRPRSKDSRSFGPVAREHFRGVVRLRVYPLGRAGSM